MNEVIETAEPSSWTEKIATTPHQAAMALMGLVLTRSGKHVYEGTVSPKTTARRRAANRVARRSRRVNRLRAA